MFPKSRLPGFNKKGKFYINRRIAQFVKDYKAQLIQYKDLPKFSQLALAHYMAIDGEAWDAPDYVYERLQKTAIPWTSGMPTKIWDERRIAFMLFRRSLPHFIKEYGETEFGYIESIPIQTLIEHVMQEKEMQEDYETWEVYHKWYMTHGSGPKHKASSNHWPVILSSYQDEVLQDGWTRFHQYAERSLKSCPAIFYPEKKKKN